MSKETEFTFRVELTTDGRNSRVVPADSYHADEHWIRFFHKGGQLYWMANRDHVISMEVVRNV